MTKIMQKMGFLILRSNRKNILGLKGKKDVGSPWHTYYLLHPHMYYYENSLCIFVETAE